ncbi:MAG: hypothetical protein SHS37scaffold296_3 [Burkholderiales phage 68_11]|nr:MAG: hypothetical protein SHS37scaffold296_3 [Burkholderiales phage 68_11]
MATKKYVVRAGFVVPLITEKPDGSKSVKMYEAGDEVSFDDDQYALHAHKLEFANAKDRDAALAAEQQAATARAAQNSPAELVQMLVAALSQVVAASPAPASEATA